MTDEMKEDNYTEGGTERSVLPEEISKVLVDYTRMHEMQMFMLGNSEEFVIVFTKGDLTEAGLHAAYNLLRLTLYGPPSDPKVNTYVPEPEGKM